MGLCDTPKIPNPADAAVGGIQADAELAPYQYLINAAATLGRRIEIGGKVYDFTGLGQADTAGRVSDQLAQTLLDLQREKSPAIIAQRLAELKAADPEGYASRQQLFDRIMSDAEQNPDRPVATDLQNLIQNEISKGAGFDDARQESQVRDSARGQQVARGTYLGNAATTNEARTVVGAGETLRNQREQNALNLLQSGASPEDVAYRRQQQNIANLGSFVNGQTPTAQFGQVSGAQRGPAGTYGGNPNINFDPNAAGQGLNNSLNIWQGNYDFANSQANPWLSAFSTAFNTAGTVNRINGGRGY